MAERVLVTGAGGFIAGHLVGDLVERGSDVVAVDSKPLEKWQQIWPIGNVVADLRDPAVCARLVAGVCSIYHLAADMGGIGYITRAHWNCASSIAMTANMLRASLKGDVRDFVYTSSACVYPPRLQGAGSGPLKEDFALPASPEGGYGWEKLFAEQLCHYAAEAGNINLYVARLFNVYGTHCDWDNGREKAPAALCRKVAQAKRERRNEIEIWGTGGQRRSFLHVADCIRALSLLSGSAVRGPVNVASVQIVTIAELARMVSRIAGVDIELRFVREAPIGVDTRIPDISRFCEAVRWEPAVGLEDGVRALYEWIEERSQIRHSVPERP